MEIIYLKKVDSTHTHLKNYIKINSYKHPLAIVTQFQTNGIGSRENNWQGKKGNLFFSFVIDKNLLPSDLPLHSSSIYFGFILKQLLKENDSKIWLKWPNDFYIDDKKIGGTITNLTKELLYCGIGLNLECVSEEFGYLDIQIDHKKLLDNYFKQITTGITWKQIFSNYSLEFEKSRQFTTTIDNRKNLLKNAILNDDGSINIDKKKVFSLR